MITSIRISVLFLTLGLLTGCGNSEQSIETTNTTLAKDHTETTTVNDTITSPTNLAKYNAYVHLSNSLSSIWIKEFKMDQQQEDKRQERLNKGDYTAVIFSKTLLSDIQKTADKAINLPGQVANIDETAQQIQSDLTALITIKAQLDDYNAAKKYEDDGGQLGRTLLPEYILLEKNLQKNYLTLLQETQDTERLIEAEMRKEYLKKGDTLALDAIDSINHAVKITDLFNNEEDFKNPETINQANEILTKLDKNLESIKAQCIDKTIPTKSNDCIRYKAMYNPMIRFTANYRDFRKDREYSEKTYNSMIIQLNYAIDKYNKGY